MKLHWILSVIIILSMLTPVVSGYPDLEYYVNDEVGVLLSDEIYLIENVCADVEAETGAQIAVLIVNDTGQEDISKFALETFRENGLGQEDKNNGLLLLIVTGTGEWRIEVGYGLEGALPDSLVGNIGDTTIEPELAVGNYFTAIGGAVADISEEILANYEGEPPEKTSPYPISWLPLTSFQLLLVGIVIAVTVLTKGQIFLWFLPFLGKGGGKNWGGGSTGGGGAGGKL